MSHKKDSKSGPPVTGNKREVLTEEAKRTLLEPILEASDVAFAKVISIARVVATDLVTKTDKEINAAKLHGEYALLEQQLREVRVELDKDPDIIWINGQIAMLKDILFGENRWFNGTYYHKNTNSGENAQEYDRLKLLRDEAYYARLQPIKVAMAAKLEEARACGALDIVKRQLAEEEARRASNPNSR